MVIKLFLAHFELRVNAVEVIEMITVKKTRDNGQRRWGWRPGGVELCVCVGGGRLKEISRILQS